MNIGKVLAITAFGILSASAVSCHHKSKEDTLEYLDGVLSFSLPTYMASGTSLELIPSGVTVGDDEKLPGIFWFTSENTAKDTTRLEGDPAAITGNYTLHVDDDFIGSLTVTCTAFADGYYNRTQTLTTNVVSDETSLVIPDQSDAISSFTDDRDGKSYNFVTINGLDWFARNLAYKGGFPALGTELLRNIFGTFYTWDEALAACPQGWRLPSSDDWKSLAVGLGDSPADSRSSFKNIAGALMTDATLNGVRMWEFSTAVRISGESGFAALPTGYANVDGDAVIFNDYLSYSVFWTSDSFDEEQAYYRYLYAASPDVSIGLGYKSAFAAPVRCVRDSE